MKELWRRTLDLFWEHPILWLPVIAADLLCSCVKQLQRLVSLDMLLASGQRHSVLGNAPVAIVSQHSALFDEIVSIVPVGLASFVNICLYTMAFLVTAACVSQLLHSVPADLRSAFASRAARPRRILGFALKFFGMFVLAVILIAVAVQLITDMHQVRFLNTLLFRTGAAIIACVGVAYCIIPSSLAFLRNIDELPVTSEAIRRGRCVAILVVASLPILALCIAKAEQSVIGRISLHATTGFVMEAVTSLVIAFPFVPLFIALSLIAMRDSQPQSLVHESE